MMKNSSRVQATPKLKEKEAKYPSIVAGVYFLSKKKNTSINLKQFIRQFQPLAEKTPEGNKLRRLKFHHCDGNGTGYCSLSDVESFVFTLLTQGYGEDRGYEIFKMYRASYIHAFIASTVISKSKGLNTNHDNEEDYVTFNEFRVLNAYICIYAAMLDAFSKVDGGGKGEIDVEDDRRIDKEEWMKSYSELQDSGFSGLAKLENDSQATIAFDTMDSNGKGIVLFQEFCMYVKETEMESKTDLGKLLSGSIPSIAPKAHPDKVNTSRSALPAGSSTNAPARALIVAGAYRTGQSCSQELMDFLRVFQPLAEKTTVGKKDRHKNFGYADQNRSGNASLAEIEIFIKHALFSSFTKDKAKTLFLRYRKCYIKAFQRAKSLHESDRGEANVADGDQYVSFSEFRLFNAYLCVYGALFDSYARINATSDRIDFPEFMKSYNYVRDYGFLALSSIESMADATAVYGKLDVDGSGQISYQEWCDYIIEIEIEADTELGKLMKLSL